MADLEFALPLPPDHASREKSYLDSCRERAWGAVSEIPIRERKHWPTAEKIRCEILLHTKEQIEDTKAFLDPLIQAIGQVLWDRRTAMPLITINQVVNRDKEQALFKITRRKLVSDDGVAKHYAW